MKLIRAIQPKNPPKSIPAKTARGSSGQGKERALLGTRRGSTGRGKKRERWQGQEEGALMKASTMVRRKDGYDIAPGRKK